MKYSEALTGWLRDMGYTHCFFVAGGNIMHMLDAVRSQMTCVPVVHEVAAGIAVEAFNDSTEDATRRAFALVTAGPGLTNIVSAMAAAWLESRELLVIGGQVKTSDLARGDVRQRGIQEIDGVAIVQSICKEAVRFERPEPRSVVQRLSAAGAGDRKGPVFIEIPLDVQGAPVDDAPPFHAVPSHAQPAISPVYRAAASQAANEITAAIRAAQRPVLLLGGGVSRTTAQHVAAQLQRASLAIVTTWNGADRADARWTNYFGRSNTWGMRSANVIVQQADLLVALGTRLGLQQTGFNWQSYVPNGRILHVDIDERELRKGHPRTDRAFAADANRILEAVVAADLGDHDEWLEFCRLVKRELPVSEPSNVTGGGYLSPYDFALALSRHAHDDDIIIPCSSGGAYTTMMQAFQQRCGQIVISDKGSASMGYGLCAAIGAAVANPARRVILTEGDGGFTQNLQELATVAVNRLNLKMFIYSNEGYASIRMTQRNYFSGAYLGCDVRTGLGFPDWPALFNAYGIPVSALDGDGLEPVAIKEAFDGKGPHAFIVPIDPEQTYFPKISSRVTAEGSMESSPLHAMSPDLEEDVARRVLPYLQAVEAS